MTYIPFSVQPIRGYGVQVALFDLILTALAVSPWDFVSSNREGRGILSYFSSLGGIPRHTTFIYVDYVFWVAAKVFIYFEFGFRIFKCIG